MKYSIGFNNDINLLENVFDFCIKNNIKTSNIEFFCGYPLYKSSLNRFFDNEISKNKFEDSLKYLKEKGFGFNYLMNSKIINYDLIDKEISWLRGLGVNTITVSDIKLISYLDKTYPDFRVVVSIIYGVRNSINLLALSSFTNIVRVIFHQSLNHSFKILGDLINKASKLGYETELLANELCFYDCKLRDKHYLENSKYSKKMSSEPDDIGNFCVGERNNVSIIGNSPWIRPEDILIYKKFKIDYIKLAGRNTDTYLMENCIKSYLLGKYSGNFFDLMDLDGKKGGGRKEKRKLDNRKLDLVLYNKLIKGKG